MNNILYIKEDSQTGVPIEETDFPCSKYKKNEDIWVCWHGDMGELAKEEAEHYDSLENHVEAHQLNSFRNRFYHKIIWDYLHKLSPDACILEIGAGSGFDAKELVDKYRLVLSDVSPEALNRLYMKFGGSVEQYIAADGELLPFADDQFEGVYMIAALHHMEHPQKSLSECARVIAKGGLLAIGMEPNSMYFRPIKHLRTLLCRLTHLDPKAGSKADALMEGFSYAQLKLLFNSGEWSDVNIRPAWLLAGWFHYLSEFLFRALKLKKRLVLSKGIERFILYFDEALFTIPLFKHFCWHWIITAKKK